MKFACYNRLSSCYFLHAVGVAQLAEHRTVAPDVVGSIPITHPKNPPAFFGLSRVLIYNAALHHEHHPANCGNVLGRIAIKGDDVCLHALTE